MVFNQETAPSTHVSVEAWFAWILKNAVDTMHSYVVRLVCVRPNDLCIALPGKEPCLDAEPQGLALLFGHRNRCSCGILQKKITTATPTANGPSSDGINK